MRSAIGFLSFLAFGVLAAGVLTVVGSGAAPDVSFDDAVASLDRSGLHVGSVLIGLVMGFVLSALARVSWTELPRRFVGWLLQYERSFYRVALVSLFIGILMFY
jgi:hypothetical protein